MDKVVTIKVFGHEPTGLFVAKSDDVKGFYAHGQTLSDIKKNIPLALAGYFEALGQSFLDIHIRDDESLPEGFFPRNIIAQGSLGISAKD